MHGRIFLSMNYVSFHTSFFKWEETVREIQSHIPTQTKSFSRLALHRLQRHRSCDQGEVDEGLAQRHRVENQESRRVRVRQLCTTRTDFDQSLASVEERSVGQGNAPRTAAIDRIQCPCSSRGITLR